MSTTKRSRIFYNLLLSFLSYGAYGFMFYEALLVALPLYLPSFLNFYFLCPFIGNCVTLQAKDIDASPVLFFAKRCMR